MKWKVLWLEHKYPLFTISDLIWWPWCSNLSFIDDQFMMLDEYYFRKICACVFFAANSNTIKFRGNYLPMCLCFSDYILELFWQCGIFRYSFYQSNHQSSRLNKNLSYFIQCLTLKWHHIEYTSFKYWYVLLSCSYVHGNKFTSIKSDMFNNLTNLKYLKVFLLFYSMLSLTIHVYRQFILIKNGLYKILKLVQFKHILFSN